MTFGAGRHRRLSVFVGISTVALAQSTQSPAPSLSASTPLAKLSSPRGRTLICSGLETSYLRQNERRSQVGQLVEKRGVGEFEFEVGISGLLQSAANLPMPKLSRDPKHPVSTYFRELVCGGSAANDQCGEDGAGNFQGRVAKTKSMARLRARQTTKMATHAVIILEREQWQRYDGEAGYRYFLKTALARECMTVIYDWYRVVS
ncbi:hypothetical protein BV25DRAFT_1842468 [Artomyces pyxidatus]|uniref:Uncharacterized protein n=1 Tax=Artomyces pyxidatus TaxID=48021 RepID=A0ACB8SJS2_9AGAM|nr:hypothetical protein BV25DRAFT_1842468 [Artomyces pyxidatus]